MPPRVRESYRRFPGWSQHFWTWYTGQALSGQQPLFSLSWKSYLAIVHLAFFAGLGLSVSALGGTVGVWWYLPGVALTIWSSRSMILVVAHQCIHRRFSGRPRLDQFIGEWVTVLSVFQDLGEFKLEHIDAHHRPGIFATQNDPPMQVLEGLGLRPGMSRSSLWRRTWWVFLTPGLYIKGAWSRIRGNLLAGSLLRRLGFLAWAVLWLAIAWLLPHGPLIFLAGFVLPVIVAAQLSALLDKLGEHAWLTEPDPRHGARHFHVAASWARLCGDPLPPRDLPAARSIAAWSKWWFRLAFYHCPARLFVVVGDLPSHDYHHRFPNRSDWLVAAYARQQEVDAGNGPPFVEVWGLGAAMDRCFQSLAAHGPAGAVAMTFPQPATVPSR